MREIKFRLWDKEDRKMLYADEITIYDNCIVFYFENHNDDETPVLMQFTGLRDKNGKEAYEGDIIEFENDMDFGMRPSAIRFEKGAFTATDGTSLGQCVSFTIIGNVYENSELITNKI